MSDRFFAEVPITRQTEVIALSGVEGHHLVRVLRAQPGAEIIVFDGSGREWRATVEETSRDQAVLRIGACLDDDRERRRPISLAVALPKGDRQKSLLEKMVELGARQLIPLTTERSLDQHSAKSRDKWKRWIIDACKQSRRNRLMEVAETRSVDELISNSTDARTLFAHPYSVVGEFSKRMARDESNAAAHQQITPSKQPILVAIGPEGGFTDSEAARFAMAGWEPLQLGPRILRVETAAIVALAKFDDV